MPQNTRALTRTARDRAKTTGETYTAAREAVLAIRTRMAETGETQAEAAAWYDDPANRLLCATCGWTMGMICPECPGCGCYNGRCSGWRHHEYRHDDDVNDDGGCPECGAGGGGDPYGECVCYEG